MKCSVLLIGVACLLPAAGESSGNGQFHVKYVAEGAVYLDAGRSAGLTPGMKLTVRRGNGGGPGDVVAELEVVSVAATSAACEIRTPRSEIQTGDAAYLSAEDAQTLQMVRSSSEASRYAQVVTFTDGDPLDEEAREAVPKPPLPEVNRKRGMIGFEYNSIGDRNSGLTSYEAGFSFRGEMTRIGGSYWNLTGYWRGRLNSRQGGSTQQDTLNDLLNRTYHLTLYYESPRSPWRAGFGRFYLPWASSLETIDGGYLGRRFGRRTTAGIFAGSTPDPTSWNYNPDRRIFGTFVNYEAGSFESLRYGGTAGIAFTRVRWRPERQFAFFENTVMYKRAVSIYHNAEIDDFRPGSVAAGAASASATPSSGLGLSRSILTLRLQPANYLSLDLSHNYFRNTPTFDPRLVGTGLLDKLLFQGLSAGFALDLPMRLSIYTNFGKSDRTGDAKSSWNQMYGLGVKRILSTGVRADFRYSRFDSAFGRGSYRSVLFTRDIGETLRFNVQGGDQNFASVFTRQNRARFINATVDWFVATHYVLGGGFTAYRGRIQSYDQLFVNLGYRF